MKTIPIQKAPARFWDAEDDKFLEEMEQLMQQMDEALKDPKESSDLTRFRFS